jgi:hypothetical protein
MSCWLEKLYADLVTADGTVLVAYVASVGVGPLRHVYGGIEIFNADGSRKSHRACGRPRDWVAQPSRDSMIIQIPTDVGSFRLSYDLESQGWIPEAPDPAPGLRWWVETPRARVVGRPPGGARSHEGVGYVDRVQVARWPRRLGLERIIWGRVHLADFTLVICEILFRGGRTWRRAAMWHRGAIKPREWSDFDLRLDGSQVTVFLPDGGLRDPILIEPVRRLHFGAAIDAAPQPSGVDRLIARLFAGSLYDDRWLSRVRLGDESGAQPFWSIHETVRRKVGVNDAGERDG